MKTEQIIILVVAFFLGMLLLNMVKNVCGCELKEGFKTDEQKDALALIKDQCPKIKADEISQTAFKYSLNNPCGQVGTGRTAKFPPLFSGPGVFDNAAFRELTTSENCIDVRTILNNCDNCRGWDNDVDILNSGCAAGGSGSGGTGGVTGHTDPETPPPSSPHTDPETCREAWKRFYPEAAFGSACKDVLPNMPPKSLTLGASCPNELCIENDLRAQDGYCCSPEAAARGCTPNPCHNGGVCYTDGEVDYTCTCGPDFGGENCAQIKTVAPPVDHRAGPPKTCGDFAKITANSVLKEDPSVWSGACQGENREKCTADVFSLVGYCSEPGYQSYKKGAADAEISTRDNEIFSFSNMLDTCCTPATCATYTCTAGTKLLDPGSITGADDTACCISQPPDLPVQLESGSCDGRALGVNRADAVVGGECDASDTINYACGVGGVGGGSMLAGGPVDYLCCHKSDPTAQKSFWAECGPETRVVLPECVEDETSNFTVWKHQVGDRYDKMDAWPQAQVAFRTHCLDLTHTLDTEIFKSFLPTTEATGLVDACAESGGFSPDAGHPPLKFKVDNPIDGDPDKWRSIADICQKTCGLIANPPTCSTDVQAGGNTFTSFTLNIGQNLADVGWFVLNDVSKAVHASTTSVMWTDNDFSSAPISLNVAYPLRVTDHNWQDVRAEHTFGHTVSGVTVSGYGADQDLPWNWDGTGDSPTLTFTSSESSLSYSVGRK